MKSVFGLVGLLVVLAIVGRLIMSQLKPASSSVAPTAAAAGIKVPEGTTDAQASGQIQQQVKDQVNATMQASPRAADEK